jgi:hypothetical protein
MRYRYILEGHTPVRCDDDIVSWAKWFTNRFEELCRVGKTNFEGGYVSTVFLGVDHHYFGEGPPILFETMVFGGELDHEQERYCTWEEAEAGHALMVARVAATGAVFR